MDEKQFYTIIIRHDSSTRWAVNNPILTYGEYAVEDDTHRVKRGDGETSWNSLPYEDFGLSYIVTYSNLNGDVSDNPQLVAELNKKISMSAIEDVNYKLISGIEITDEDGLIGKISKFTKNINTGTVDTNIVLIKSTDQSLQGYWTINDAGAKILNLSAKITIEDYKPGQTYHKDYICYYKNRLYRAVEDFEAEREFNPNHWAALSSKYANEIVYDNHTSGLNTDNVQEAIDETNRRVDNRVVKTDEINRVYGTSNNGTQITIPIKDLSVVESVNGQHASADKNIQLDASNIKYNDSDATKGTVREVLDSKLDKTFVGGDNLLVKNIQFNYNENTGYIECIEEKVSTLTGQSTSNRIEINVISEAELQGEVLALNNTINAKELDLNNRITREIRETNERITSDISTLDTKINTNYSTLDTKIGTEKADVINTLNIKDADMDNKKIDKNLSTSLVSEVDLLTNSSVPTIRVTSKNTSTKESIYDYIHFMTNGNIKVSVEDEDHLIFDVTDIDSANQQQDNRLSTIENRLNANDINITTLMEHDVNHDRELITHSQQISLHETRLVALESGLETANSNIEIESDNRIAADTALSGRITENALNLTSKVDKSFASNLDNKILGKIESDELVNTDVFNLKETFINPFDGSLSSSNIKIVSSNGTIVATRSSDGVVDLTAHVNLDVNYFVTSETLNTEIAGDTVIHINSLTPANKVVNAGRDVVSDVDGTLARVTAVDTENGTCTVMTFQKNTQVVWGNIGGTLTEQTDLKTILDTKLESVNGKATSAQSKSIILDASNINVSEDAEQKITVKTQLELLDSGKVNKTLDANKVYGTDIQGNEITYDLTDLYNINTVNGVAPDNNKSIVVGTNNIASDNIAGTTTTLDVVISELQNEITKLTSDLQGQIKAYEVDKHYTVSGNYTSQNYVTLYNGINVLMAKVLRDFTSDSTEPTILDSFIYDVEHDNLLLVGIPEEISNE